MWFWNLKDLGYIVKHIKFIVHFVNSKFNTGSMNAHDFMYLRSLLQTYKNEFDKLCKREI